METTNTTFDPKALNGPEFTRYQNHLKNTEHPEKAHDMETLIDFEEWPAIPVFEVRGKGTRQQSQVLVGIKVTAESPLRVTRVSVRKAILHNQQIESANARAGKGTFLILKS